MISSTAEVRREQKIEVEGDADARSAGNGSAEHRVGEGTCRRRAGTRRRAGEGARGRARASDVRAADAGTRAHALRPEVQGAGPTPLELRLSRRGAQADLAVAPSAHAATSCTSAGRQTGSTGVSAGPTVPTSPAGAAVLPTTLGAVSREPDKPRPDTDESASPSESYYRDPQCRWKHRRNCKCRGEARQPIKLGSGT